MPLFLIFLIIPVIEIFLFIEIGSQIGTMWTIISVLTTAFIGTALVKKQGMDVLKQSQQNLAHAQFPLKQIFSGICILVAGAFLLTPGFLTDSIGFLLLFPPFRSFAGQKIINLLKNSKNFHHSTHETSSHSYSQEDPQADRSYYTTQNPFRHTSNNPTIIDGDFEIIHESKDQTPNKTDQQ